MNKKKPSSITTIVAVGIGAAVFFILGRFLSIPSGIPNTNFETTYPFLALMSVIFGPTAGLLIGLIGHAIKDFLTYGLWWSWVLSSAITGFGYGIVGKKLNIRSGEFSKKNIIFFNLGQIITNIAAWGIIAPILDILIYSEPANKVFFQGIVSAGMNSVAVGVLGTLLLIAYTNTRTKSGSLTRE